jgi:hypothetical protein
MGFAGSDKRLRLWQEMNRTDVAYLGTEVENLPIGFSTGGEELVPIIQGEHTNGTSIVIRKPELFDLCCAGKLLTAQTPWRSWTLALPQNTK